MKSAKGNPHYLSDRWVFYIICPVLAISIVHIGNENSLGALVRIPSYYSDLLLSFALTFGTTYYIRSVVIKFSTNTDVNLLKIGLLGVIVPTITLIVIEIVYQVFILGIPLSDSSIFYLETPLIFMFCLMINLIYLLLSFKSKSQTDVSPDLGFVVHKGTQAFKVPQSRIAYFYTADKSTFIVDTSGQQFFFNSSLRDIEDKLDQKRFVRVNRQIICRKETIVSFERTETRKLKVTLEPDPGFPVYVSKSNSQDFQKWLASN